MAFSLSHFYSKGGPDQVDVADGGTDGATAAAARTNLGVTVYDEATHDGLTHSDIAGSVTGRANAGAVSGAQPVVRLIDGTNVSVALVEAGGELQFTITVASVPVQVSYAETGAITVTTLINNPGFTPAVLLFLSTQVGCGNSSWMCAGIAKGVLAGDQWSINLQGSGQSAALVNAAAVSFAANVCTNTWAVTTFSSSDITITPAHVVGVRTLDGVGLVLG